MIKILVYKLMHLLIMELINYFKKSKDDFERALQQKGITISRMTSTGNITYEQGGNKARAKSLGAFNRDDVSSLLERNKSLGQTISRGFSR